MLKRTLLNVVLVIATSFALQAQFKIQAEYRPRFEFRDGFKTPLTTQQTPAIVASQRSRLNLEYFNDGIEIFMALQDVRVWGDEVYKTDEATINVYQAYAGYNFTDNINIRLGRQELAYDNNRLLGARNWNNVGASHDIALLRFTKNGLNLHYGIGYNNDKEKNSESNYPLNYYKYLSYLWINKTFNNQLNLSIVNIADGHQKEDSDTRVYTRITSGFYSKWANTNKVVGFDGAFYYQYGKSSDGSNISAYYFSISPFYQPTKKFKILLGNEFFSGDDNVNPNSTINTFDKLYGNGHGPYGYMDYWTEIPKHTKNSGLMDNYLRFIYNSGKKASTEFTIHNFRLTNNAIDTISNPGITKAANKQLGVEIDLMLKYKLHPSLEFRTGYSTMLANESMEIIKGGSSQKYQQWAWVMFIFKPTLFKHEFND